MRCRLRGLALSACVWATACAAKEAPPPPEPTSPPGEAWLTDEQVQNAHVVVESVGSQGLSMAMITSGRVTFDDLKVARVFSPVTGRVARIDARPGERVRRGASLAIITSPDLSDASSDVDKARSSVIAAQRDYERQRSLFESHAAAQRDFEAAQDKFLVAKAEYARVQKKLELLSNNIRGNSQQSFVLRSPIEGEVIARNINPGMEIEGQYNGGGSAPELFVIGSLDSVWVMGDVYEMDVPRVHKGQAVKVNVVAYPDKDFIGSVEWVAPAVDANSRSTRLRCIIDNPKHELKPEMFATITVAGSNVQGIAVPQRSIFRLAGRTAVFVETGKTPKGLWRFEQRDVTIDDSALGAYVPVHSGLHQGDRVVTQNGVLLTELVIGP